MQVSQQLKLIAAFYFHFIIFLIDCLSSIGNTIRIRIYKTSFPSAFVVIKIIPWLCRRFLGAKFTKTVTF
jgi:hypothetical protein